MKREISVHGVNHDALYSELAHLVQYLLNSGYERCKARFGWHWGIDYYPDNKWESDFSLSELESEVRRVENSDLGWIGGDDLSIWIPPFDWEFCFCHHEGIHLSFTESVSVSETFCIGGVKQGGRRSKERSLIIHEDLGINIKFTPS